MTVSQMHSWFYDEAKHWVESSKFADEICWTASRPSGFTEADLLREAAWVVLCSGFREAVVRKKFGHISFAFFDWVGADQIANDGENCIRIASPHFGNQRKLAALVHIAESIAGTGFEYLRRQLLADPIAVLLNFPFVGPVTSLHLAKNLGIDCVKPDRHLVRLAVSLGFVSADEMCSAFAAHSGDSLAVIDTVLWRYCEQHRLWEHTRPLVR